MELFFGFPKFNFDHEDCLDTNFEQLSNANRMQLPLGKRVDLDTDPSQRQYDFQSFFVENIYFGGNKKTGFSEKLKNEVFEILDQTFFH